VPLLVTGEVIEVTGADPVPVPEPEPVAAGVVPALEPVPEAAEVTGAAAGVEPEPELAPVPEPVAAEVTDAAAEVTGAVAEVVLEPELARLAGGLVAACACREKTSKTTRIPAAAIATCIARRAMSRMIGCGISSSPITGTDPTLSAPRQRPETRE